MSASGGEDEVPPPYLSTLKDGTSYFTRHPEPESWCCHGHVPGLDPVTHRRAVCVHEAGHLVVSLDVGMHVKTVEVDSYSWVPACGPRLDFTGAVTHAPYELRHSAVIMQFAAGERAEQRWLREQGRWTEKRGWAAEMAALNDRGRAIERLIALTGSYDLETVLGRYVFLGDQVEGILDRHWPAVLAVAEALDAAGELTGDQAAELAGLPNPMPA
ncbi:hypothetical protein [Kitasatospora sp. NPDC058046]|uniref:hypothetical protein n=1 Tax=Kitasatospora sp. NPDC058046 TaxID=3346312 RepID=UPI0036DBD146